MKVSLIAALDEKRGLGKGNELLWRIPDDLKNFKKLTMGHYVLLGRKTFESIGKALPGRTLLVLTRRRESIKVPPDPNIITVQSIEEAMDSVKEWASDLNRASIIHSNLTSIHIVDVTPFLRFEDDVFIHIECMEENTLIHARSSSRVGVSDLGVNPDRLDSLISHLKLGGSSSHGC